MVSHSRFIRIKNSSDHRRIWTVNCLNHPLVIGNCDPNKYWPRYCCSLKFNTKWKYLNLKNLVYCFRTFYILFDLWKKSIICQNIQLPDVKIKYIFSKNSIKMYQRNFSQEIILKISVQWIFLTFKESSGFPFSFFFVPKSVVHIFRSAKFVQIKFSSNFSKWS